MKAWLKGGLIGGIIHLISALILLPNALAQEEAPIPLSQQLLNSSIFLTILTFFLIILFLIILFKTRRWKRWWLKGGLIGIIIFPMLAIISKLFFTGTFFYRFFEMIAFFSAMSLGWTGLIISFPLLGFLIGAFIGWIIGKIKSKKEEKIEEEIQK